MRDGTVRHQHPAFTSNICFSSVLIYEPTSEIALVAVHASRRLEMHDHDNNYTRRLIDVSDQVAEVSRRIRERAQRGEPRCEKDAALLAQLKIEMNRPRQAAA